MYQVNAKQYDENSEINKKIIKAFVKTIIHAEVTPMVQYILSQYDQNAPFSVYDASVEHCAVCPACGGGSLKSMPISTILVDYDDGYICPVCGEKYEDRQDAQACCAQNQRPVVCLDCGEVFDGTDDLDFEVGPEIEYKWYLIDRWAAEYLSSIGQTTIITDELSLWGTEDEEDELVDSDMVLKLAERAEIMDGQTLSWRQYVEE